MTITETQARISHVIDGLCGEHFHASVTEVETCEFRAIEELRRRAHEAHWTCNAPEIAWRVFDAFAPGAYARWIQQPNWTPGTPLAIYDDTVLDTEWSEADIEDYMEWLAGERLEAEADAAWARSCPWG